VGTSHLKGQYHFEVNNGIVRWFHRDQAEKVVFETMAHTVEKGISLFCLFLNPEADLEAHQTTA